MKAQEILDAGKALAVEYLLTGVHPAEVTAILIACVVEIAMVSSDPERAMRASIDALESTIRRLS